MPHIFVKTYYVLFIMLGSDSKNGDDFDFFFL